MGGTTYKSAEVRRTGRAEVWKGERLLERKRGRTEDWKAARSEERKLGSAEGCKPGSQKRGSSEAWKIGRPQNLNRKALLRFVQNNHIYKATAFLIQYANEQGCGKLVRTTVERCEKSS
ncbi:MAG: hypothetical protein A2X59_02705 [Nitrospirae bacterium GWC2_42_7]|nr:MAG: hypothetical protein A2X59_02705 [Nitrospirae bacterium GWC2_42_7]